MWRKNKSEFQETFQISIFQITNIEMDRRSLRRINLIFIKVDEYKSMRIVSL